MLFVRYLLVASFSWIPEEQKTREAVIVDAHRRYFFRQCSLTKKNAMDISCLCVALSIQQSDLLNTDVIKLLSKNYELS